MSDENTIKVSKGIFIKILIPLLIVAAISVIWIVKNSTAEKLIPQNNDTLQFALNVTEPIDLEELKSHGLPILIDFGADSCIPCKEMAPVLKELNQELQGKAIILFVDIWKNRSLADGYPISLIPTQVLITNDGKPYIPSDSLSEGIKMYTSRDTNEHVFTTHEGGLDKKTMLAMLKEMGMDE
ncbi:MAG TPA: thioredoxin [Ruminococcaceae bacterium]|nr:thioredoxin [Oscillospiraceae bacterium]